MTVVYIGLSYLTIDYFLGRSDWSGAFSPPIVFPGVKPTDSIEDLSSCSLSPRKNFPVQGMVADSIGLEKGGFAILEFYRNNA